MSGKSPKGKPYAKKRRVRRQRQTASTLTILHRLLLSKVKVGTDNDQREMTTFEAIILHLLQKEAAGDSHASRVLSKYERLKKHVSEAPLEVTFVGGDYTSARTDGPNE